MKILKGFTLAEVLITLAIIGIVAAVTLPTLQANIEKAALSTQLAKFYTTFDEALKIYMLDENMETFDSSSFDIDNFARNYLHVTKVCQNRTDTDCFADRYTAIDNPGSFTDRDDLFSTNAVGGANGKAYILKDGTTLTLNNFGLNFDVNGKKGPNKIGYDLHSATINRQGSIGRSQSSVFNPDNEEALEKAFNDCKKANSNTYAANGCWAHLLKNNFKFDY